MVSFPLADDSTIVLLETASEYSALVRADTQQERVNRDSVGRRISNVKRILTDLFSFSKIRKFTDIITTSISNLHYYDITERYIGR